MKSPSSIFLKLILVFFSVLTSTLAIADGCGEETKCIFVFGNSITQHGKAPAIGWEGNWGMAATSLENDYVAQLVKLLIKDSNSEKWKAHKENISQLETNPDAYQLPAYLSRFSKQSDIAIVELGDNFSPSKSDGQVFAAKYLELLNLVRPNSGTLVCVSTWWLSATKNQLISDSCKSAGGVYVDISDLSKTPANVAGNQRKLTNSGVAAHPSDMGMQAIADKIMKSLSKRY